MAVEAGDIALETARKIHERNFQRRKAQGENVYHADCESKIAEVAELIQSAMNAQERELNAAIGILARLPWCECGHQHVGGEICMGCDCDQQIPVSREWLVKQVKSLAERGEGR